jgi:trigger factor
MNMAQYMQMTNSDEAKLLEEAKGPALRQVRMDLAIAAIAKAEGIEITDADVDAEYEKMAAQYGMEAGNIKKYIEASVVREQILRNKAIEVVAKNAVALKVEEKEEAPKKTTKKTKKAEDAAE